MKINGRAIAKSMYDALKEEVQKLQQQGITPKLAVILVGDDPGSKAYIKQKETWAAHIGAQMTVIHYPLDTTTEILLKKVQELNTDPTIHGIILQRPLPQHIDKNVLAEKTAPQKDIDGFHPESPFNIPVALAVTRVLEEIHTQAHSQDNFISWLNTKHIIAIGKGETAGGPIIGHLQKMGVTVHIIDTQTPNPDELLKNADIVISAVGKQEIVTSHQLKKDVIIIGVGLHKEDDKLKGDFREDEIAEKVSFYTPTPGGIGPINVAYLMKNLVQAAQSTNLPQ